MEIRVMSWNVAGAKLLGKLDSAPHKVAASYVRAFAEIWETGIQPYLTLPPNEPQFPDIILLQECIGFINKAARPSGRWQTGEEILQQIFKGYTCFFFPALSSHRNPHPGLWNRYKAGSGIKNYLPDYVEAQHGYGICIRKPERLRKVWVSVPSEGADVPADDYHLCFEAINTTTGLYLGNRDTEPRLAIMGRMLVGTPGIDARYLNFLNVHLTTLKGERMGNVRINRQAGHYRLRQLDLILDNVISAYQEADAHRIPRTSASRKEDVWIMGGDFNATPDSEELLLVKRVGFVDGNPDKEITDANPDSPFLRQIGTKWSLANLGLPLTPLDYVLCGLEHTTFPTGKIDTSGSQRPFRPFFGNKDFETDHAVVFACFEL